MSLFIGRQQDLAILNEALSFDKASLIVVRGRRRIGKSRLIREFSKNIDQCYLFSGLAPDQDISANEQREEFVRQMREQRIPSNARSDWGDLFYDLAQFTARGRILIVLDEITWMAKGDKTFLAKLKNAWDTHFKQNSQLIFIISGSDSSWIEENILSKTGFFDRISLRIKLTELALNHCAEFWGSYKKQISAYEKLKVLAVTGGVPRYLEEINPRLSAEENIYRLCYRQEGTLFNEFEDIFNDLFQKRGAYYRDIVKSIADGCHSIDKLAAALNRSKGGDLSRALAVLCQDGFIARENSWNFKDTKQLRISRYRISDNYLRFYLKYILPYRHAIEVGNMESVPDAWHTVIGLQFKNLVINNRRQLHQLLRLQPGDVVMSNPYLQTATSRSQKCQIDYLIQTKHNTLYLCEIKFSRKELGSEVMQEVQEKEQKLMVPKGFSIRTVLIHVNGVADSIITAGYFSHVINFSDFLE